MLENGNEEQKALAAARLEETQTDMGEDEASKGWAPGLLAVSAS